MSYVTNIVEAFGGVRPCAAAIGKPVSTVQSWKTRGSIPDSEKAGVLSAAKSEGLEIGPADFFPVDDSPAAA